MGIGEDVVIRPQVRRLYQANFASSTGHDPPAIHRFHGSVACVGEVVCVAESSSAITMLPIPGDREPARGVEVAFLLVEYLVKDFIDSRQSGSNRHLRPVRFQHT
ncbi:hypothetical protein, partial [Mycobacterium gordonae]|uniref:hypothetical protein n=1 Tax=Mycobacterium gordonae TaxID=1778 RepID=UPI001C12A7B2